MGTDSHTTMINGVGVVGWGVGGIEAEACMLGQPISMLLPQVVGFKLSGRLPEGATATDLVLTVTQMLRKKGVVGKFVEFYGPGVSALSLADRATISNMAPGVWRNHRFLPDRCRHARLSAPDRTHSRACRPGRSLRQGTRSVPDHRLARSCVFRYALGLDLSKVVPSLAGPKRPQDRIDLPDVKENFLSDLGRFAKNRKPSGQRPPGNHQRRRGSNRSHHQLHQHVESVRHDCCRLARQESRRKRLAAETVGEDVARARLESRLRLFNSCGTDALPRAASTSISSVMAAPLASGTAGRCRRTSRMPLPKAS